MITKAHIDYIAQKADEAIPGDNIVIVVNRKEFDFLEEHFGAPLHNPEIHTFQFGYGAARDGGRNEGAGPKMDKDKSDGGGDGKGGKLGGGSARGGKFSGQDLIGPTKKVASKTALGSVTAQTPGSMANFPEADAWYGPTQLAGIMLGSLIGGPGPGTLISGVMAGLGKGLADRLGMKRGPQRGWSPSNKREDTRPSGSDMSLGGEQMQKRIKDDLEKRNRQRQQASQTLLGSTNDSKLGGAQYIGT